MQIISKPNSAFISSLLYDINFIPTDVEQIKLTFVDGTPTVYINQQWFNTYETPHQASILVHEILHYALQHDLRKGLRDSKLFQRASDQVVNNLLLDMEYELPSQEEAFTDRKYKNTSVESVYQALVEEEYPNGDKGSNDQNQDNSNNDGKGSSFGNDLDFNSSSNGNSNSNSNITGRNQSIINAAKMLNKSAGTGMVDLDQLFEYINDSDQLDWAEVLRNYCDDICFGEMSYYRFNRRMLPRDLYLPDIYGENKIEHIAVAMDVSGSVSEEEIKSFLSEVKTIMKDLEPEKITLISFSDGVKEVLELTEKNIDSIKLKTGGGTRINPVLNTIKEFVIQPKFLITFSDMYIVDKVTEAQPYPIVWVSVDNDKPELPYMKGISTKDRILYISTEKTK